MMFKSLFNNKPAEKCQETEAAKKNMQETKERFFAFITKLEERLKEFAEEAIPQLMEMNNNQEDGFKGEYHRMKAAVTGQIDSIMKKVDEVREEKITYFSFPSSNRELTSAYYNFRTACYDKYNQLDKLRSEYTKRIDSTETNDYEIEYQLILQEYEAIKDKFKCVQCGSPIFIDKIYFTTTYISCGACQTKNTFEPSSRAKSLEHLGRSLAEQRTAHLKKPFQDIPAQSQELYLKAHQLGLTLIHEKDKKVMEQTNAAIEEITQQREELENTAPQLYQTYLRVMFNEWNKINPDMKEEHEKFYLSLLKNNQYI